MQGGTGAFAAHLVLGNLHRQHLPDMDFFPFATGIFCRLAVTYIEKGIFTPAYIHKGRLHPRQYVLHYSLVNVAHQMGVPWPFQLQPCQPAVFRHGNPGFLRHDINDNRPHKKSPKITYLV